MVIGAVLLSGIVCENASGQTYTVEEGNIHFRMWTPLFSFEGQSSELVGRLNKESGRFVFSVPIGSFKTGIDKRDRDMYQLVDTGKYPMASFEGRLQETINFKDKDSLHVMARGTLSLHGTGQIRSIPGWLSRNDEGIRLSAGWVQDITDFKLSPPRILFYSVADTQRIRVKALLTPAD